MFDGCNKLEELNLSSFQTNSSTSMIGMFAGCSSLQNLYFSYYNIDNENNIGMFTGCALHY